MPMRFCEKKQLVSIEEENKLSRLFDIDVISVDGDKISPHGHLYAAKKMSALWKDRTWMQQKQNTQHRGYDSSYQSNHKRRERGKKSCRFREYQKRNYFAKIEFCIRNALLKEVGTTPKPGLVDLHDTGAHKDMDYDTFVKKYLYDQTIYS